MLALAPAARADNVIADDNIVQGSECVGLDCLNGESFGTDSLRLKGQNNQIGFDDTGATAGLAANDWALRANEVGGGGANVFQLLDVTGSRTPFSVFAGAPTDSL